MMRRLLLTIALVLMTALSRTAAFAAGRALEVREALGILGVANRSPINLSADGVWVAYTVSDLRRHEGTNDPLYRSFSPTGAYMEAQGCDVWVANTRTGETQNLTGGQGSNWDPVWSPDGRLLAFYSDHGGLAHLWLWDSATRKLRQLSDAIAHPAFNFATPLWTPDGRRILIKALPAGMTVEQSQRLMLTLPTAGKQPDDFNYGARVTVFRSAAEHAVPKNEAVGPAPLERPSFMNQYRADLVMIDVGSGRVDRIATGVRPLGYWISPDGSTVAYTNAQGMEANTQQTIFSLETVPSPGAQPRVLVPSVKQQYGISVSWSPDSRSLAYSEYGQTAKGDVFQVSLSGGEVRDLTPGAHPAFGSAYAAPVWDRTGDALYVISAGKVWKISVEERTFAPFAAIPDHSLMQIIEPMTGGTAWTPDGRTSMVVMTHNQKTLEEGLFRIDSAGASAPVFEAPVLLRGRFDVDVARDGSLAYVSQDATTPDEIWTLRDNLKTRARAVRLNPQLDTSAFGRTKLIDWRSVDGQELRGALLLPSGYEPGKRYPLVVVVYGGASLSTSVFRFGTRDSGVDNMQLLATRGYAVLLPDAPLHPITPMRDLLNTVLPGVDRAVELGIADPQRLGVMGHSYGGYSTLSLIVQTTRFRAAVDSAGPSDLISLYGQMDPSGTSFGVGLLEKGQGGMQSSPWEHRDRYIENSPLFYLDRVKTPLLIVQGQLDHAVPQEQGDEVYIALQRLGKEVEYAKYAGEEHWEGTWTEDDVLDYWARVVYWFDEHLK